MLMSDIKILVACECSQVVCKAFRDRGFTAFSCDLLPCYGGFPGWHIQGDAYEVCRSYSWHCVIAHPPCTYLSHAGACHLYSSKKFGFDWERFSKGFAASKFFRSFFDLRVPFLCVENPTPETFWNFPKPSCIIQPWEFGSPYKKRTCLWLRGLPSLLPTSLFTVRDSWTVLHKSQRIRSRTFPGVAAAMADQWGSFLVDSLC